MLSFHPLGIEDKKLVDRYVFQENSRSADFNFGNMFMWDESYHQHLCEYGNRLIVLAHSGGVPIYPFPIGKGELKPVVDVMKEYAVENDFPFVIRGVEEHRKDELEKLFPNCFEFTENRQFGDYIYSAEKLSELKGKNLHSKRNFVNRFMKENNWSFCQLEKKHFDACTALLEKWCNNESIRSSIEGERAAITRAMEHYGELELLGGCLFSNGKLIAFCMGELIAQDCFNVHFEKAESDTAGAYQMVNREFVRLILEKYPQVNYVNREDDMGLENLRQAKMSYHPEYILKKFTAQWRT